MFVPMCICCSYQMCGMSIWDAVKTFIQNKHHICSYLTCGFFPYSFTLIMVRWIFINNDIMCNKLVHGMNFILGLSALILRLETLPEYVWYSVELSLCALIWPGQQVSEDNIWDSFQVIGASHCWRIILGPHNCSPTNMQALYVT